MKSHKNRPVYRVVVLAGISAMVAQLLFVRECIAQFSGNEFVIALILFNWLMLGAIGNRMARIIHLKGCPATPHRLAWLMLILAVLPTCQIVALRCLRDIFFIHGSDVEFYATFLFILMVMAPYGLLAGIALPYSLFALTGRRPESGARIYILDNIGNVLGGVLFTFVLIYLATPLQSLLITNLFLLGATAFLLPSKTSPRLVSALCLCLAIAILAAGVSLGPLSLKPSEGRLAYYRDSAYGRILLLQNEELLTLFEDGNPVAADQDAVAAEETIHYALSQIHSPKRILILSARGNMIAEINKYDPVAVDCVELNPEITRVLMKFSMIPAINAKTTVIHQDARSYLANTDKMYDAVIVNLPDPDTLQINRFYTDCFFAMIKQHLSKDGIFSFSVKGFDAYLDKAMQQKLSCLYNTVSRHFRFVVLLPGTKVFFLCRDHPLDLDIPALLKKRRIETVYAANYFYGDVSAERITQANRFLDKKAPINKDLSPFLIRFMLDQWVSRHKTPLKWFVAGVAALILWVAFTLKKNEFVLFTTGYAVMGAEILTVLSVQIFFGYIYSKIGLIVTVFIAGLFPGTWAGRLFEKNPRRLLMAADAALIVLLLLFTGALQFGGMGPPMSVFVIFGLCVSFCCGFQFPLVFSLQGATPAGAVRVFSADLMGAAFGTLLTSVLFIPFFGLMEAVWSLIVLKAASLLMLQAGKAGKGQSEKR